MPRHVHTGEIAELINHVIVLLNENAFHDWRYVCEDTQPGLLEGEEKDDSCLVWEAL